jgi:hypothetical protein
MSGSKAPEAPSQAIPISSGWSLFGDKVSSKKLSDLVTGGSAPAAAPVPAEPKSMLTTIREAVDAPTRALENGAMLGLELNNVKSAIDGIESNLVRIQRADRAANHGPYDRHELHYQAVSNREGQPWGSRINRRRAYQA